MEQILSYISTGIVFFIIFSAIILIHEGGHFWAARFGKIGIEEFGFGLPPRLWGKKNKKSGVLYSINWIPFGGFVRMLGEDNAGDKKTKKNPHAFSNRPLWARIFAVSAGVIMNFILGWFLLFVGFASGMEPILIDENDYKKAISQGVVEVDDKGVFIAGVEEGSPADKAGIEAGDFIMAIDVTEVNTRDKFLEVKDRGLRGRGFHLTIQKRDYSEDPNGIVLGSSLAVVTPDPETGNMGVYLSELPYITKVNELDLSIPQAAILAAEETYRLSIFTVIMLGDVVTNIVSKFAVPDSVGGPVAIAQITHHFVQIGDIAEILKFAALLSISIAVINIMPFPALDGGRLLFLLVEMVTRRPVSPKWEGVIHGIGFLLLIGLLLLVTWNDISRILTG